MDRIPNGVARTWMFKAYLSADHVTPATSKTIGVTISKNKAAFATSNTGTISATELSNGFYYIDLNGVDTGTNGPLALRGAGTGVDDVGDVWEVVAATNGGFTALPAVAAGANGGVPLGDASGRVDVGKALGTAITLDANSVLNVSAKYWAGTAIAATSIPVATAAGAAGGLFIAGSNAATTVSFTGNITGNLSGSVGSVTGAVGSVTGAVGSVTGNVGGNVTGSVGSVVGAVGSVTGAVGSVAGNVGGNVVGSVGSVTGLTNTTITTAVLTTAMTEGYRANGATGTLAQLLYEVISHLGEATIVSTTKTIKKVDHATTAETFTLNDATTPTAITRAT